MKLELHALQTLMATRIAASFRLLNWRPGSTFLQQATEQLFSAADQIYSDRRNNDNLQGENAEKLLFLAYNIRLFEYKY